MSVTWNTPFEASPAGSDSPALGDDKIREFKEAFRERFEHEHKMDLGVGTAALDGWHIQGSAISYIQADAPTTRPDGVTALSALDNGRLWVDTDDDALYAYIHGTGWVALVDVPAIALNTTHRSSDGDDHGFIDQDLKTTSGPSFSNGVVPAAYGAIGTIVIGASDAWDRSTEYLPGTTIAGNTLYMSTSAAEGSLGAADVSTLRVLSGSWETMALTGTWRLLSRVYQYSSGVSTSHVIGLLQRIS